MQVRHKLTSFPRAEIICQQLLIRHIVHPSFSIATTSNVHIMRQDEYTVRSHADMYA